VFGIDGGGAYDVVARLKFSPGKWRGLFTDGIRKQWGSIAHGN